MNRSSKAIAIRCDLPDACPIAGVCAVGYEERVPCLDIWQAHDRKLQLCEAIEAIADGLPSAVDRLQCLQIANQLVPLLRESHRYEEEHVFPVFERACGQDAGASAASIRRLKAEHVEDECAAQDLTEVLLDIGHGGSVHNPEALGFMMRAFFETIRRHIAFEREHVVPVIACAERE